MVPHQMYWHNRQHQLWQAIKRQERTAYNKLVREYDRWQRNIAREIAYYYKTYASKEDVLAYRDMLVKLSPQERTMLYQDYDQFIVEHPGYSRYLPVRESIYRLNRLEGFRLSVKLQQTRLGIYTHEVFEDFLTKAYKTGYRMTLKGLPNADSFFSLDDTIIYHTINKKWVGKDNFSGRIWRDLNGLTRHIAKEFRDGLIRGDKYSKSIKVLQDRFGVGKFEARRLVATESTYSVGQANLQAFVRAGIKRYTLLPILDARTSKICRHLPTNKQFKFLDAVAGKNYPPFHPFCRTSAIPVVREV